MGMKFDWQLKKVLIDNSDKAAKLTNLSLH